MKENKKTLLSLNKRSIQKLNYLSMIVGGNDTDTDAETDADKDKNTDQNESSAYAPPTGFNPTPATTLTNGLPGNDCC